MRSQIVRRPEDPKDVSYPHLRICRTEPNLVVLFTKKGRGMIVSKPIDDSRPLFLDMDGWDDDMFDYFDEAVLIQNY